MFERILVPLDFTPKNKAALEAAFELARVHESETMLLHVVFAPDASLVGELASFYAKLVAKAERKLAAPLKRFEKAGLTVRAKVVTGDTLAEIRREAVRGKADLVVLASHRIDPRPGLHDWGTVSYKAAVVCPCPVLLVK